MALETSANSELRSNRQLLGACWIVYGIARLIGAVVLAVYGGTATVMFGSLLQRVPNPFTLMGIFHVVYMGLIVLSVFAGGIGLIAGIALLSGGGRKLALAAAILSVSEIPFGTTLGIYTLVVFLP